MNDEPSTFEISTTYNVIDADSADTIGRCGHDLYVTSMDAGETGVVLARLDGDLWVHVEESQESFWRDHRGADVRRVYCLQSDDRLDFSVVSVEPVCGRGSDVPDHYCVTARLHGPIPGRENLNPIDDARKTWGGALTTWLGVQQIDGSLGCTGWVDATQWVDPAAERVLGVKAAIELGERILAAAVL